MQIYENYEENNFKEIINKLNNNNIIMNVNVNKITVDDLVSNFNSSKFDQVIHLSDLLLKQNPNNYIIYSFRATYSSLQDFKKSISLL